MNAPISYALEHGVARITLDDGKANVMSETMIQALGQALDQAEQDQAVVLLTGRPGVFSAGFDLPTLRGGGDAAMRMLNGGFALSARLAALPLPVVVASTGHALAMGVFLVMAADVRIGVHGAFKYGANEVAIGLPVPYTAVELCRARLLPTVFQRAMIQAEIFQPEAAQAGGFIDRIVEVEQLNEAAQDIAASLAKLDRRAYVATKLRVRAALIESLPAALQKDDADFRSILSRA